MFAAGVRATARHGDAPGGPAFAGQHQQMFLAEAAFGFEDQRGQGLAIEPAAAYLAEIGGESFLRRIPKQLPGYVIEDSGRDRPQGRKHEPHHGGAAFDVFRARAVNAVAIGLPMEIVSGFFLGRKDRVQMRYHGDGSS